MPRIYGIRCFYRILLALNLKRLYNQFLLSSLSHSAQAMHASETNFGSTLFVIRTRKGATQAHVALRAGLGRGYYSQLENSRKGPPSPRLLQRIVDALELDDGEARRLLTVAVADRCMSACESVRASTPVATLVRSLVQSASNITLEKAARIEAILREE